MPQTFSVGARSLFVTTMAWLVILLTALFSATAFLQQDAFAAHLPIWVGHAARPDGAPDESPWLQSYFPWIAAAVCGLLTATLASAVGLLLRLEWARRLFMGLLMAALAANAVGLWAEQEVMHTLFKATLKHGTLPAPVIEVFGGFVTAAQLLAVAVTLMACAALAWVIRHLNSPTIRQEFA